MSDEPGAESVLNPVVGSINPLTNQIEFSAYGYNVTEWTAALFVALFGLSTLVHIFQSVRWRMWFLLWTIVAGGITEIIGWSGRLWSAVSTEWLPYRGGYWYSNDTAFTMQISTLIIAPAFLTAALYIMLGRIMRGVGVHYSLVSPRVYLITFVGGDIASLVIQAIGGGTASAAKSTDQDQLNLGTNIMVSGIVLQMVVMILYTTLFLSFAYHWSRQKTSWRLGRKLQTIEPATIVAPRDVRNAKLLMAGLAAATVFVFIRSVFRTIELLGGWRGPIIENEALFCTLDGLMILLAQSVFNFLHPARLLPIHGNIHTHEKTTDDESVELKPAQSAAAAAPSPYAA